MTGEVERGRARSQGKADARSVSIREAAERGDLSQVRLDVKN